MLLGREISNGGQTPKAVIDDQSISILHRSRNNDIVIQIKSYIGSSAMHSLKIKTVLFLALFLRGFSLLEAAQPNVLFVAVDDLRPEIASFNNKPFPIKAKTPES